MEDYYKILGIQYNASITDISNSFNLKMIDYKCLPFITDKDKQSIKNLKKAFFVLSNDEYKKTYDNSLKQQAPKKEVKEIKQISGIESGTYFSWTSEINPTNSANSGRTNMANSTQNKPVGTIESTGTTGTGTKKQLFNHSYISDRIFSLHGNNNNNNTVTNSETLRPKNVGLSSDAKIEFDTPIDYS